MKHLTNEILEAIPILEKQLQLLPNHVWRSVVNSGHGALVPYEAWEDLRTAYFASSKCNYEATRSRDFSVALQIHGDTAENQQRIATAWKWASDQADFMTQSTLTYLQQITKKEWFVNARKPEAEPN